MPDLDLAGIDAAEGDRADERIVHDLEGEHRRTARCRRPAHDLFARLEVDALDRRHVERRRQIVDDRVEQRLHALVLEGRAAEHRNEGDRDARPCGSALQRRLVGLLAVEIGRHARRRPARRPPRPACSRYSSALSSRSAGISIVVIFGAERLVLPDDAPSCGRDR